MPESVLEEYRQLAHEADSIFARVQGEFPHSVICRSGCSDCCHALFDLSFIEAYALNQAFHQSFGFGPQRSSIVTAADAADRQSVKLKRHYYQCAAEGMNEEEIFQQAGQARVRCPLLGSEEACSLYDFRPITCRVYGMPVSVRGKAHVCGLSSFAPGGKYPTLDMDKMQDKLARLSLKLAKALQAKNRVHQIYVPVSMALLNKYDAVYLGQKATKD